MDTIHSDSEPVKAFDKSLYPIENNAAYRVGSKFKNEFITLPDALNINQVLILLEQFITKEELRILQSTNYRVIVPMSGNGNGFLYTHELLIKIVFAVEVYRDFLVENNKQAPSGSDKDIIKRRVARGYDSKHLRQTYIKKIELAIEEKKKFGYPFILTIEGPQPQEPQTTLESDAETEAFGTNSLEQ